MEVIWKLSLLPTVKLAVFGLVKLGAVLTLGTITEGFIAPLLLKPATVSLRKMA